MQDLTIIPTNSTTATIHVVPFPNAKESVADFPKKESSVDPFLIRFYENDPDNPKNWSSARRWYLTMFSGLLVLNATFASSAPSAMLPALMEHFTFSSEVGNLVVSLFVAGYCVGPLIWGPLSEQYGRRPVFVSTFFIYVLFEMASALAKNTGSLLVFRFLGGVFAACPLTNSGALLGDIWDPKRLGIAMSVFSVAPIAGPAIGPLVGGYLAQNNVSWRWLFWILTIFAGVCWVFIVLTLPETFQPIILVHKARDVRKRTGDNRYYAPFELRKLSFAQRIESILARPFKVLFSEPMLMAITVYMSFVYGCLYMLFEAYPIVFTEGHQMSAGSTGLTFLPILIGGVFSAVLYVVIFNPRYERRAQEFAPNRVPPEYRLEMAMAAAPFFAIAFFWFAWTSYPSISIWAPLMSGLLVGWGVCWIFLSLLNYIIDAYLMVSASALAANTVVRSLVGAGFPLFADQMYNKLNPRWASTLLGFVALAMAPIPFVLFRFGPTLRMKSKYAPSGKPPAAATSAA
ncbi:MFS general substrate transporter [Pisolithus orientalis]|uniref:MFS general substrate transporter n=1 Tax=Pisolithus orientalis TaxID=936130 RepID=UPI0022249EDD|nr:MFS general substrate transporter [Pisolithus orientalis]KAI5990857.1 MFS general substrate transporter [Pisolithus orientalis]